MDNRSLNGSQANRTQLVTIEWRTEQRFLIPLEDAMQSSNADAWDSKQVVRFYVGSQQCALDILQVKEVINPVAIAPMPHAPAFVEGIVELRGSFLPMIDLRKRFGVPPNARTNERTDDDKFVIALFGAQRIGLIVDRVLDVRRIAAHDIDKAPELTRTTLSRFVVGVAKWEEEIALLLDIEQLLTDRERDALP